jgi:hypothetical protein
MSSKLILCLALVLSSMMPGSFGVSLKANAADSTNTTGPVWGEAVGGFQLAAVLDESNAVVHCWIRNATTNQVAFNDFYFGYVENVKFEICLGTNWTSLPSALLPATPWSGGGALGGKLLYAQPGQMITHTWSRRHAMYSRGFSHDTFAVDLIGVGWPPTSQLDREKLEARVVQAFYPASSEHPNQDGRTPQLSLYSPTFVLKTVAIRSFVNRFPRMPVGGVPTNRESAAAPVPVADIKITFAKLSLAPSRALPTEVLDPPSSDVKEYGPFTNIVAGHIASLDVTWANPNDFKTENQTRKFLRELLSSTNTETWTFHVWSWAEGQPSIVAAVNHTNGKQGAWMIWCSPGPFWAYKDENGKWWWGSWKSWKGSGPKSLKEP